MAIEQIDVDMDAARVCDAIARIGYSPAAAIMDIVDNAVTAGATRVMILIETDPEKTYAANSNIIKYAIIDNGSGMSDDLILKAFRLGSPANYPPNSLSKYGMGLKSAGFSLGGRIQVASVQKGQYSRLGYIDREAIGNAQKYVVCRDDLPEAMKTQLQAFLGKDKSGTIVTIEKCAGKSYTSAKKIIDQLQDQLGVVYYTFLSQEKNPLSVTIRCTGKPDVQVKPFDILFTEKATKGFDPDKYDCKTPCLVLDEKIPITGNPDDSPVKLQVVLFPQAQMANHPKLTEAERQAIKAYAVSRANKGFFVYRNNRLIRWGEDLGGIVGKDDLGFRARLLIESLHDDSLHVDVSKQRMSIPDDLRTKIETLVRTPLRNAEDIFNLCRKSFPKEEGGAFNDRNQDLVEEDLDEGAGEQVIKAKRERKKKLEDKTKKQLEEEGEQPKPPDGAVDQIPVFEKIRYSEKVKSIYLWEAGYDPSDGTFVRINKNHPFYQTVIGRLEEASPARQALEALIWSCAAAENLVFQNLAEVEAEAITKVLERFKKVTGSNLDTWASNNQDLIPND